MAFVYLVQCRDGSLYCGWALDPVARTAVHNSGTGAAYTRSRRPVRLVWCEACSDKRAAMRREYAIKRLSRAHKLRLIALSPLTPSRPPSGLPAGPAVRV